MTDYVALQQRFHIDLYASRGLSLLEGNGARLRDSRGDLYLDMMSGYGTACLGYRHPRLEEAVTRQWQRLPFLHGSFASDVRARAAQTLVKRCGPAYHRLYWSNSGAEAVEAALKFAVLATGKRHFVACRGGYHGKTLGALSATHAGKYREPFLPLLWDFDHVPYGDERALEKALGEDTAAFIVEPVQGESGVILPPAGYLREALELCRRRGVLLILDEVQTGCGRTGAFLRSQVEGLDGDILCLGKALAGGLPVGATLVSATVNAFLARSLHSSTFAGSPLVCAAVLAVLEALDAWRMEHVCSLGGYFRRGLAELVGPLAGEVRGLGLMVAIEVGSRRNEVLRRLQHDFRILAIPAGEGAVRFLPPYVIGRAEVDSVLAALGEIAVAVA